MVMNMQNIYAIIENQLVVNNVVADAEFASQQGWVLNDVNADIGWKYIDGQFIPYTPVPDYTPGEIVAINTTTAQNLLINTDWTQLPDVSNPLNDPRLLNLDEFNAFRDSVRKVAVNPPTTLVTFAPIPTAIWNGITNNKQIGIDRV